MKLIRVVISILFSLVVFLSTGQQTSGAITYKLEVEGEDEDAIRLKENLAGSEVRVSFSPKAIRVQTTISADSKNTSIIDKVTGKVLVLVDKKKIKVAYFSNLSEVSDHVSSIYDLKHTNEKKTILGFSCKKVTAFDSHGNSVYYWYTEGIDYGIKSFQVPAEIPGICLEYSLYIGTNKIIYRATEFSKAKLDESLFELKIPEGFKLRGTGKNGNQAQEIETRKEKKNQ